MQNKIIETPGAKIRENFGKSKSPREGGLAATLRFAKVEKKTVCLPGAGGPDGWRRGWMMAAAHGGAIFKLFYSVIQQMKTALKRCTPLYPPTPTHTPHTHPPSLFPIPSSRLWKD